MASGQAAWKAWVLIRDDWTAKDVVACLTLPGGERSSDYGCKEWPSYTLGPVHH